MYFFTNICYSCVIRLHHLSKPSSCQYLVGEASYRGCDGKAGRLTYWFVFNEDNVPSTSLYVLLQPPTIDLLFNEEEQLSTFLEGLSPQVQIVVVLCLCVCVMTLIGGAITLLLLVAKSRRAANNISAFISDFVNLHKTHRALQIDRRHISKQKAPYRTRY